MVKWFFTLSLILLSALLVTVTPLRANDCDPTVDYNSLGHTQYAQGEYNLAIASFTCAVQANPEAAKVYNARGNTYRKLGDYVSAIADYDKAIEIDDEYAIAYNNRGWSYFKLGDPDRALENYNQALEIDPDLAYAYNNRGLLYQMRGQDALAMADFNQALDHNLPASWTDHNLGLMQAEARDSIPENRTSAATPEAEALVVQAFAAYDERDFTGAAELFTQVLAVEPEHFRSHYYRGRCYIALDEFEAARADFTWMIETQPAYPFGYWERTVAAVELGDLEQARADAAVAYRLDPDNANNLLARALIAEYSGDYSEAGRQFLNRLETYGTEPVVVDPLTYGETRTLQIERYQIYAIPFYGEADQTLRITADSADMYPIIVLLDVDGNPINGDMSSGLGASSVINGAQLPAEGIYTLLVSHGGGGFEGEIAITITVEQ